MTDIAPYYVAGAATSSRTTAEVYHPYDGRLVGAHAVPTPADVERAVAAAHAVRAELAATTAARRATALSHVVEPARAARRRRSPG